MDNAMLKDIVAVQPLEHYRLQLRFEDGAQGVVDVRQLVRFSGVFALLSNPQEFASVQVNPLGPTGATHVCKGGYSA